MELLDLSGLLRMADFDAYSAAISNAQYNGNLMFPRFIAWPGLFRK